MKAKYLILTNEDPSKLSDLVTLYLNEGYALCGGLCMAAVKRSSNEYGREIYAQAVVIYEEKE